MVVSHLIIAWLGRRDWGLLIFSLSSRGSTLLLVDRHS